MPKYYSPEGNIEVWEQKPEGYYTVEEWEEMHPTPPAPEPTSEEKLAELEMQYNLDKTNLLNAYQTATIYGDTDLMESLKADLAALDEQYDADYEAIINEGEEE